ncbi:N-acetylglutamate kinase [Anseongella ginsenosidimutans]|uniref:Acetylglutamate kinase n=1 Tax=Anseongella ginsenosidimutans TaxID=496056 RepID=A0A4R3KVY1_9SPHI|nr:acetylglutamate kinase [Anseongella ginsenosidimutans]QEC51751.1 acetylglutamate kinase [Anseongella ginsenosidimutans]TCS89114.1 N-acetylglutamate kinase [Anseongella ginsenosidimutans]
MQALTLIKIGGNVIDDPEALAAFLQSYARVPGLKVLVHGGGKIASTIGIKLGIAPKMAQGRRITDEETLDVVTMVYAGLVNKRIVSKLQAEGVNALGLTGADGNIIPAAKRPVKTIDYGFAGDIEAGQIGSGPLSALLENGLFPVIAPITHDGKGQLLNTNADTIAAAVAESLSSRYAVTLVYCFEKKGVLKDPEDEESVIFAINPESYAELKEKGIVSKGMIPKLDNAFAALKGGVKQVHICRAADLEKIMEGEAYISTRLEPA